MRNCCKKWLVWDGAEPHVPRVVLVDAVVANGCREAILTQKHRHQNIGSSGPKPKWWTWIATGNKKGWVGGGGRGWRAPLTTHRLGKGFFPGQTRPGPDPWEHKKKSPKTPVLHDFHFPPNANFLPLCGLCTQILSVSMKGGPGLGF